MLDYNVKSFEPTSGRAPPPRLPNATTIRTNENRLLTRMVNSLQEGTAKGSSASDEAHGLFLKQNRVVGREHQLLLLDKVYERVSKAHSEIVLIHGPSGVGKSTLLETFVRKLPPSVFYINGKFDQLQSHAPYAALVSASDQLCRQALRRKNSGDIRDRLRKLLGPEINLLGSLIPNIAKMTADKTDGSSQMANNVHMGGNGFTRFKLLFRAFLRCVASRENPIILFLDDIQWADGASLEVLRSLVTDSLSKHIIIVGAYRDGEKISEVLRQCNLSSESGDICDDSTTSSTSMHRAQVTDIEVTSLDVDSLNDLISSVLDMDKSETLSLSTLVLNKTDGNVFYALNFLDMLLSSSLLVKTGDGLWTWDTQEIVRGTDVSDNLGAILKTKLRSLPEQVRSILQIASFIGHTFTTEVLATIVHEEQDMIETEYTFDKHSRKVIYDRIINTLTLALAEGLLETTAEADEYKFSHDKVQHCLYLDLIPDDVERNLLHQRIGSLIWSSVKSCETSELDDWVFLAAENLNRAVDLVDYSGTRYEVIEVNLRAAKRAMEMSAFLVASTYLRVAVSLLEGDTSWDKHYELCIDLYSTAAESEKNTACFERSRNLAREILKRAKSFQQQLEAYSIEVQTLAAQGNLEGSILLALDVLRKVGVKFSKKINMATVAKELVMAKMAIGKRSFDDLLQLPTMADETKLFALDLMNNIGMHAFVLGDCYKETYAAVSIRMVRLTVRHGLSPFSAIAFASWGAVHATLGNFDIALKSEELSFKLIRQFNAEHIRSRTEILNYSLCHLWRNALDSNAHNTFLQAYHLSLSFGDVSFGYYGFAAWLYAGIYLDVPLSEIHSKTRAVVAEGREYGLTTVLILVLPCWQFLLNISDDAENPDPRILVGEAFDEEFAMQVQTINSKGAIFALYQSELILGYTYEDWDIVKKTVSLLRNLEKEAEGYFTIGFNYTWFAVSHYELYLISGKRKHKREARRCHSRVAKWTTSGTIMLTGANKWLEALEGLCVKKVALDEVETLFQEAFVALAANKNRYFEALASERLARLFLTEDAYSVKGHTYLKKSIAVYRRWGALAKAEWLEKRYNKKATIGI